jgi:hypothetical protein
LNDPGPTAAHLHYINGIQVKNVSVLNFDTAFLISDVSFSQFDFIQVQNVRVGFVMLGQNLGTFVEHFFANYLSTGYTSNKSPTVGFLIDLKQYPRQQVGPEGITLSNSIILSADEDLVVNAVYQMNIVDNIFDGAGGDSVVITNPNNINFERNYVATVGPGKTGILVKGGIHLDGLNISSNLLNGSGAEHQIGIYFLPGFTHRDAHIENNRIQSFANGIVFGSLPIQSSIRGNYGWNNGKTSAFITIQQTGTCGQGTTIEGNTTTDPISVLSASTCSGFHSDSPQPNRDR